MTREESLRRLKRRESREKTIARPGSREPQGKGAVSEDQVPERYVLLTGAGRGIGLAIARILYRDPRNRLTLVTRRKTSLAPLRREFPNARNIAVDITDTGETAAFISSLKQAIPRLDLLINNAGVYVGKTLEAMTDREVDELYAIHLRGPILLIRGFLPVLRKAPYPQIIDIASGATNAQLPTESVYTAVKTAITALGRVLQLELQNDGIRVTTIRPWTVNTHDIQRVHEEWLRPEDVALAVSFVANTHPKCEVLDLELSATADWRGAWPPWTAHSKARTQ